MGGSRYNKRDVGEKLLVAATAKARRCMHGSLDCRERAGALQTVLFWGGLRLVSLESARMRNATISSNVSF